MENYFTIYKTTNLENGKIYIGYHETLDIFDSYLGSGSELGMGNSIWTPLKSKGQKF